jgi:hypothetical protein
MSQNSVIFAALVIGFIVYITIKGELPAYVALFWIRNTSALGTNPIAATAQPAGVTMPSQSGGTVTTMPGATQEQTPQGESIISPTPLFY